jgi:ABC-type cobalamin/Fe3+-siderophores transport system ATPase subunit
MSDELREIQIDRMLKQAQVQTKMSAFGVCFVGGSGVGKSLLMEQTARTLIQAAGEVPSGDKIVSGQMSDKFDSNEMPHHLVLMYDDVANNSNNENYDKLLNAVNAQSRPFLKAAVEEKGIMFPGNIGCVISTNVPGYNAHKSNCPDSLGRRFLHIEVKIKPSILEEICVPGTKRIDPILAAAKGTRMDIWMFNVFEFVTFDQIPESEMPEGIERWEGMYVRRLTWTNKDIKDQTFWDLALFLKDKAKTHYASQKKLLDKLLSEQQESFCEVCCIPCSVCACHTKSEFLSDTVDLGI